MRLSENNHYLFLNREGGSSYQLGFDGKIYEQKGTKTKPNEGKYTAITVIIGLVVVKLIEFLTSEILPNITNNAFVTTIILVFIGVILAVLILKIFNKQVYISYSDDEAIETSEELIWKHYKNGRINRIFLLIFMYIWIIATIIFSGFTMLGIIEWNIWIIPPMWFVSIMFFISSRYFASVRRIKKMLK